MTYTVCMPIVGYAYTEVEADSPEQAIELGMLTPWDELDIAECFVTDRVTTGNVLHHPVNEAYAEKAKWSE